MKKLGDEEQSASLTRKLTEFFFYAWNPSICSQGLIRLAEDGIPPENEIIPLANSLWLADVERIKSCLKNLGKSHDPCPFRFGMFIYLFSFSTYFINYAD